MKKFRIEFFDKVILEFRTISEANKWAKENLPDEVRTFYRQRYFRLKEIKKDCDGQYDCTFTEEVERDAATAIGYAAHCLNKKCKQ